LDGSVWIATFGGLDRWKNGQVTTYDKRDGKLGGLAPDSLFQDDHGRIWVSTNRQFGYLENDRFIPVSGLPGGVVHGIAEDKPEFCVQVQGTSRELAPLVRDDVYRIASEALRNAFRHAHAARIEVKIRDDPRQLCLRVWDNGKGIDPTVLEAGERVGHYGLPGMRERAKLVGGKLSVWSDLECGTETELTIPASIAYAKSQAAGRPMFWKKGA